MPSFHHSVAVLPLPLAVAVSYTVVVAVAAAVAYLFAVYGCNGTEFYYVIFTEQRNFTTAEGQNGNGRTATEWWKPCMRRLVVVIAIYCKSLLYCGDVAMF